MKKVFIKTSAGVFAFFLATVAIYWFNLDTKAVKALEKPMAKWYDNLPRDNKLSKK